MMKRIISTILVVVMLTLTLVGCGYSFTKDDMANYASFAEGMSVDAFKAALKALEIEDGDFGRATLDDGTANPKRVNKIADHIYDLLLKQVDEKDTDSKLTAEKLDKNDLLYYCYYATYVIAATETEAEKTVVIYPSKMTASSPTGVKLGYTDDTITGYQKALKNAVLALMTEGELDFSEYAYETKTSGNVEADKVVYVNYTVTTPDGTKTVYKNVRLEVKADSTNEVAKELYTKATSTAEGVTKATVGTSFEFNRGEEGNVTKYTDVKVNFIVEKEKAITFEYTLEEKATSVDKETGDSITLDAGTKVNYNVYPVHYFDVIEYNSEVILKTLISSLSKDSLECLKDAEAEISAFTEKLKAFTDKETAYDKAVDSVDTEKDKMDDAYDAAKAAGEKAGKTGDDLTAYINADSTYVAAKTAYDNAVTAKTTAETEKTTAETEYKTALSNIYKKVDADETKGAAKIVEEYEKSVKDTLVETYNKTIRNNLAKAVWEKMVASVKVNGVPEKAVDEIYERLYESHEYTFYTGTESTSKETNYNYYDGNFKEYLIVNTIGKNAGTFEDAKAYLKDEAEKHVKDVIVIYFIAEQCGLEYDKKEIKEFKKGDTYEMNEYYYGEINALAAYQFDAILDHFLESDTDENTGDVTYKNVAMTYKGVTESTEEDDGDHDDHDH